MTIQQTFDDFLLSRRLADLSAKTIIAYKQFIIPFLRFLGADTEVNCVRQDQINAYIEILLDKDISKATRTTHIRHLKVYLKWMSDNYQVKYDYKRVKVPKNPKKNVRIYSSDELMQIFNHAQAENDWLTLRNKCIIALMYDSGLRQSEVCNLERSRVSFSDNRMTVTGKGNKERTVPIGAVTLQYMRAYLEICPYKSNKVFVNRRGAPLTCNAVKQMITKLANSLEFDLSSHKLRHNFATNYCIDQYEKHGQVDIYRLMILMGHEEVETTRRYLHHANEIIGAKNCISHLDKVVKGEI